MKRFLIIILLSLPSLLNSQSCLPNGITFSTQVEIDSFQINYPNCTQIEGDVLIWGSDIINLINLNVLTAIDGHFTINGNFALTSLSGLDSVTSIGGVLQISSNLTLTNLEGFGSLKSVGGLISIWDNPLITDLTGLDSVSYVGGGLSIAYNNLLTCLTGLNNVNDIGGGIDILSNPSLSSLTGLEGLTSIWEQLSINRNNALTSLTGIDNIDAASILDLQIYENSSLSSCAVQSICDYLASPGGTVAIYDNANGCNNQQEVEAACGVGITEFNGSLPIKIYPNPASNFIYIDKIDFNEDINIVIYNQIGQNILLKKVTSNKVDLSSLAKGIYIVEIKSNNWVSRHKLVKN